MPGTDACLCLVGVPIVAGDRVLGSILLENHERENAFGEAEVRLLSTVAASMGVALENARLFDETQRLLKETEQRAAELAVINSIQEGIAAELDFQAIVDLVGDKLREVLQCDDLGIRWHDPKANLIHYLYSVRAWRAHLPPMAPRTPTPDGPFMHMLRTRERRSATTALEIDAAGYAARARYRTADRCRWSTSPFSAAIACWAS